MSGKGPKGSGDAFFAVADETGLLPVLLLLLTLLGDGLLLVKGAGGKDERLLRAFCGGGMVSSRSGVFKCSNKSAKASSVDKRRLD